MKNVMKHPRDRGGGPIDWKKFDWTSGFGLRGWLLVGAATFAGVQGIVLLAELLPYALKPSFREQYSINRPQTADWFNWLLNLETKQTAFMDEEQVAEAAAIARRSGK